MSSKKKVIYFMPDNPMSGKAGNTTRLNQLLDYFNNNSTLDVTFVSLRDWGIWKQKDELSLMQKGAVLINVGRGGIVNEADLAEAIDQNGIYAGIDVTAYEPMEEGNPLLHVKHMERLVMSPYVAWASVEARAELIRLVGENIKDYIGE